MFISLLTLAALTQASQALDQGQREDLKCFEASAWALSWMGHDDADGAITNTRLLSYYFLGRLSAGNTVDWLAYAHADMAENRKSEQARSADLSKCSDRFAALTQSSAR